VRTFKIFAIWTIFAQILQCSGLYLWLKSSKGFIYGTNDDAIISSIASGQLTGNPDPHWIFVQPILSVPLTWLESNYSDVNVYILFLVFVATISFSVILGLIVLNISKKLISIALIIWILNSLTFISWFAMAPSYTAASIFSTSTSLVSLIYLLQSREKNFTTLNKFIFVFFTILSFLIRVEATYVLDFISIPIFISNFYKTREINNLRVIITPALLIIFIILINAQLVKIVYSGIQWQEYLDTNAVRHKIQLRAPERILEKNYQEFGWDKSTLKQFTNFELADPNVMNKDKLNEILERNSVITYREIINNFNVNNFFKAVKTTLLNFTWILYLIVFEIVLFSSIAFHQKYIQFNFVFTITFILIFFFMIYILSSNYHVPERITFSILGLSSLVLLSFFMSQTNRSDSIKSNFFIPLIILSIISSLFYLHRFKAEFNARQDMYKSRNELAQNQSKVLGLLDPKVVVISGASSLRFDWVNPYQKFKSIDPRDRTLILGWYNLSPVWIQKVKSLSLDSNNIYINLFDENVFWASQTESELDIQEFINKKFNAISTLNRISDTGTSDYGLYKINRSG
jgi:hypothetical protein